MFKSVGCGFEMEISKDPCIMGEGRRYKGPYLEEGCD